MKINNRNLVFHAEPWMRISIDSVTDAENRTLGEYYDFDMGSYSMIYAETTEQRVILERQYKHGLKELSLVFPEGGLEQNESPLEGAKRELLEETGYISHNWVQIGQFVLNEDYGLGLCYMFKARGAFKVREPKSGDLEDMEIILMPPDEIFRFILNGGIKSLGAVAMASMAANSKIWSYHP